MMADERLREAEEHRHVWSRSSSSGFFSCTDETCLRLAVCPGCLGGKDGVEAALRVSERWPGVLVYWCAQHSVIGEEK